MDIKELRKDFKGLEDKQYFNFGGQGILANSVLETIIDTYRYVEKVGPFGLQINSWINENVANTKSAIALETNSKIETITLSENVTDSCNIALWGIEWKPDDEILLSDAEHPGIIASINEIKRRFGVKVTTFPIVDTLNQGNPVEVIKNHLTPQTRLVVISHVLWNTGQVLPLKEISQVCHQYPSDKSIQILVDGAQSAGLIPLNLPDTEVDFYGCTGHKWLCGPTGVGFLYVKENLETPLHPTFIGWRSLDFSKSGLPFAQDGSRYEVATSAYPLYTGLTRAIALHQTWGNPEKRYQRICQLSAYLWEELNKIEGIKCLKNTPPQSGLVSFYTENPSQLVSSLESKGYYLRTLAYPSCVRACVHYFTLESEIESLVKQIRSIV
ncbi:aminotransferase class V-fold PLP-dependent enzyme [Cyanobacterium sp. IPPAS B-1200]|uniref:aminotransferase class V-fold PLP-dependent enzyme n=1 Tax=Cyanobacterium sp. IPPAS B-1200 TaxID=1562720 RepID=UPI0008525141|nr:aminotransferase class V-fold PLP-dependent enzyme [Cyanobacterium sp. IPPAS B-1200]OEJ78697.1 cysteine lyase [Cyanobacterium sp. IPPAS B-1200]